MRPESIAAPATSIMIRVRWAGTAKPASSE
jgi:hypothetical protein